MIDTNCFLCAPDPSLTVASLDSVNMMVGLGPITPTYAIIASREHVPSFADVAAVNPKAISQLVELRQRLEVARGPLLMTEHGRVPVCRDDDRHEAHCFHAHALLFALGGRDVREVHSYYARCKTFHGLDAALEYAAGEEAYMLVSRSSSSYDILAGPLNAPRQLARTLAALAVGEIAAADWRSNPRESGARDMALALRKALEGSA